MTGTFSGITPMVACNKQLLSACCETCCETEEPNIHCYLKEKKNDTVVRVRNSTPVWYWFRIPSSVTGSLKKNPPTAAASLNTLKNAASSICRSHTSEGQPENNVHHTNRQIANLTQSVTTTQLCHYISLSLFFVCWLHSFCFLLSPQPQPQPISLIPTWLSLQQTHHQRCTRRASTQKKPTNPLLLCDQR